MKIVFRKASKYDTSVGKGRGQEVYVGGIAVESREFCTRRQEMWEFSKDNCNGLDIYQGRESCSWCASLIVKVHDVAKKQAGGSRKKRGERGGSGVSGEVRSGAGVKARSIRKFGYEQEKLLMWEWSGRGE